jgi:hypothetical protein
LKGAMHDQDEANFFASGKENYKIESEGEALTRRNRREGFSNLSGTKWRAGRSDARLDSRRAGTYCKAKNNSQEEQSRFDCCVRTFRLRDR